MVFVFVLLRPPRGGPSAPEKGRGRGAVRSKWIDGLASGGRACATSAAPSSAAAAAAAAAAALLARRSPRRSGAQRSVSGPAAAPHGRRSPGGDDARGGTPGAPGGGESERDAARHIRRPRGGGTCARWPRAHICVSAGRVGRQLASHAPACQPRTGLWSALPDTRTEFGSARPPPRTTLAARCLPSTPQQLVPALWPFAASS
eukprot:scaffold1549_cov350-Prasinococcus_capsulatus_cf.AAC.28